MHAPIAHSEAFAEQARTARIFQRLRKLKSTLEQAKDKTDHALVMIAACLDEGINERRRIIPALVRLGFKQGHIAIILSTHTGNDPASYWWSKGSDGIYKSHHNPEHLVPMSALGLGSVHKVGLDGCTSNAFPDLGLS